MASYFSNFSCSGSEPFLQLRETCHLWLSVHALDFLSEPLTPSFLVDCADSSMSFSASAELAETSSLHPRVPVWDTLLCSITLRGDLVESGLKLLNLDMVGSATACFIRFVAAFFVAKLKSMLLMTLFDALAITSVSLGISFSLPC